MLSGAERWLAAQGRFDRAKSVALVRKRLQDQDGLDDIPLEVAALEASITRYKEAWNENDLTPKLVNETWKSFWGAFAKEAQLDDELETPPCDRYANELAALRRQNRGVVLLPNAYMTDSRLWKVMSPLHTNSKLPITNLSDKGGCIDVEMTESPSYMGHTAEEAIDGFMAHERVGQRFPTYLAASYFRSLLTMGNSYFDRNTGGSILFSSSVPDIDNGNRLKSLHVSRKLTGGISVYPYNVTLDMQVPTIGFRSEGRKT